MQKKELLIEFFVNKNYDKIIELFSDSQDPIEKEFLARAYLENKKYAFAEEIYKNLDKPYEYGRCCLLQGNLEETQKIWNAIEEDTPAVLWGKSLLEFINLYVIHIPTFFQIRAFLEVDLDALLNAGLITYCENIANGAHLFAQNNQESYKFIGRVFVNNKYYDLAELFLNKAKDICYIDPEVHFLLAKCYLDKNNITDAQKALNTSIEKGYGYYPAKKLLEKINLC